MNELIKMPKIYFDLIDQVFDIERKVELISESNSIHRNINKMKDLFESAFVNSSELEAGLSYHNPIGELYNETRTDLEASIAGDSTDDLIILEVIKPIIRLRSGANTRIVRKGVVIAGSKTKTL